MKLFSALLDRLSFERSRSGKLRIMSRYFKETPDPDRGWALAALTDALDFTNAKPRLIRELAAKRFDPTLFAMSYDYVGDLSETVALIWSSSGCSVEAEPLSLDAVVSALASVRRDEMPALIEGWLEGLDETGRWALLKLITGGLRVGVSARLAKAALAELAEIAPNEIEEIWHSVQPPYLDLFAWLEGRAERPKSKGLVPFRSPMLAHAIEPQDFEQIIAVDFIAEWKWDGIRVQACAGGVGAMRSARLYSRSGDDISAAFPDLIEILLKPEVGDVALDGELLIVRNGETQPFSDLQRRLNRKSASVKLQTALPAHIRAYDLLAWNGEDLRTLPFGERRGLLERFVASMNAPRIDISPLVAFSTWADLEQARANPEQRGAGLDANAVEGVMIKRVDSPYLPGRPRGLWWKWKHDPMEVDAVLMYAQRGHGKRSSFYSDFTFGVWRTCPTGDELTPVGKAYFGFTDAELARLDKWVRAHTRNRYGPVREVEAQPDVGLVLQIAFEGLSRSSRHRSGLAMRFPRIARIRWDKPPREAGRLEALALLVRG